MSEADELNTIVAEWVEKAEADLACAAHLLRLRQSGQPRPSASTLSSVSRNTSRRCSCSAAWTFQRRTISAGS